MLDTRGLHWRFHLFSRIVPRQFTTRTRRCSLSLFLFLFSLSFPSSLSFRSFRGRGRVIAPARYFMKLIVSAFADTRPRTAVAFNRRHRDEAKKKKVTASAGRFRVKARMKIAPGIDDHSQVAL